MGLFDGGGGGIGGIVRNAWQSPLNPLQLTPQGMAMGYAMNGMGGSGQPGVSFGQFDPAKPPGYQSIRDEAGYLKDPYKVTPQKLGDTSAWQQLAQQQNTTNTTQGINNALVKSQTGTESAWSQLAQNGGLQSGARERIAKEGARDALNAGQMARAQGDANSLNIGLQGLQMDREGERFNIGNDVNAQMANSARAVGDVGGMNQHNQFLYDQDMKNRLGLYSANSMMNAYNNQPQSVWQRVFGGLI